MLCYRVHVYMRASLVIARCDVGERSQEASYASVRQESADG